MLNYVKDFKNNTETLLWKEKHGNIRGVATVELFEDGKKVLEAKTENMITSAGYAFFKRAMKTRMVSGTYFSSSLSDFVNPFQTIYLYNINTPETDEGFFDIGDDVLVGYSIVDTYVGSSSTRGTLNTSESFVSENKFHFVFDWPTHAANGTFRTILFGNSRPIQITTVASFESPDTAPAGLAWDGQHLWLAGNNTLKIYKLTTTGTVVALFDSPDTSLRGLTWDGQYLWLAGNNTRKIYKLTTTGTVVASFDSPDRDPTGLAWDGQHLWLAGYNAKKIYKLTTTGTVVASFDSPDKYPYDLAWDGQHLWLAGDETKMIYKLTTDGTAVSYYLASPDTSLRGLAWDGRFLWMSGRETGRIYKLSLNYGARTLLPAPITKTSMQTMKIQYDFVFED